MTKGLQQLLARIIEQPTRMMIDRYLALLADLSEADGKTSRALDLAEALIPIDAMQALRIALMVHQTKPDDLRAYDLMIDGLNQRGRHAKAEVLRLERARLFAALSVGLVDGRADGAESRADLSSEPDLGLDELSLEEPEATPNAAASASAFRRTLAAGWSADVGPAARRTEPPQLASHAEPVVYAADLFELKAGPGESPGLPELDRESQPPQPQRQGSDEIDWLASPALSPSPMSGPDQGPTPVAAEPTLEISGLGTLPGRLAYQAAQRPIDVAQPLFRLKAKGTAPAKTVLATGAPTLALGPDAKDRGDGTGGVGESPYADELAAVELEVAPGLTPALTPLPAVAPPVQPTTAAPTAKDSKSSAVRASSAATELPAVATFDLFSNASQQPAARKVALEPQPAAATTANTATAPERSKAAALELKPAALATAPGKAKAAVPATGMSTFWNRLLAEFGHLEPSGAAPQGWAQMSGAGKSLHEPQVEPLPEAFWRALAALPQEQLAQPARAQNLQDLLEILVSLNDEESARAFGLLLEKLQLASETPEYWGLYLDTLQLRGLSRRALVAVRTLLSQKPQLDWAIVAWARLPKIWQGLAVRGFVWREEAGVTVLLSALDRRPRLKAAGLVV